jgi:hypothetical protein
MVSSNVLGIIIMYLITVERRYPTHKSLDFNLLILYEANIPQQFKEPPLILIHCHASKLEFKELFHLLVIIIL